MEEKNIDICVNEKKNRTEDAIIYSFESDDSWMKYEEGPGFTETINERQARWEWEDEYNYELKQKEKLEEMKKD